MYVSFDSGKGSACEGSVYDSLNWVEVSTNSEVVLGANVARGPPLVGEWSGQYFGVFLFADETISL